MVMRSLELERYSDKYRPSAAAQPSLKRKDLHQPFFPQEVFEAYFNPKKKRKGLSCLVYQYNRTLCSTNTAVEKKTSSKKLNLDELADDEEDLEKSDEGRSDEDSQVADEDYDVDEEYDNDYAENYFDNGEGDDNDDLGGGGGGEEGGGTIFPHFLFC